MKKNLKSAVAFFFLFFLHGFSIENGQQGISYNIRIYATSILHPAPILNKLKNVIMYRCGYFFTQQLNIKQ